MSLRPPPSRKRKCTHEDLLKSLEIISAIPPPLPHDLPPSPPASRSASPAPTAKRKLDSDVRIDSDSSKRSRIEKSTKYSTPPTAPPHKTGTHGSDTHEEGELHEEHPAARLPHAPAPIPVVTPALPSHHMPVRRPRRGKGSIQDFDKLHDKYHSLGRRFKYSGDARFWSTFPPTHKHFKQLLNPPEPGTPYHTHGGLMSRLELLDALLCFVYSLWCQDYARSRCASMNWSSIGSFLSWCKQKWMQENGNCNDVRESAFVGVIHMIEAFIHQRKVQYAVMSHVERDINDLVKPEDAKAAAANPQSRLTCSQRTPPGMLPSPAGTASTNSTPTNPNNGTPNNAVSRSQPTAPSAHLPAPVLPANVPAQVEISVPQALLLQLKDIVESQNAAAYCMNIAQQHLSLVVMREHFPRTFGRMVNSSLTAQEEHEPDMEDEDGELFWPGQCVTGQGLGWVCLMGRSMVKEFGNDVSYVGVEGIIPKPDQDDRRQNQRP